MRTPQLSGIKLNNKMESCPRATTRFPGRNFVHGVRGNQQKMITIFASYSLFYTFFVLFALIVDYTGVLSLLKQHSASGHRRKTLAGSTVMDVVPLVRIRTPHR